MKLCLLVVLLQLWANVEVSLSQTVCSQLPSVPHASVTERTQSPEYREGHVVHFTCETGYVSGPTIRYMCTTEGWVVVQGGKCSLKPCQLPEDTPNGYYQIVQGDDFVFGTTIRYFCNAGYQMVSKEDTRTCLLSKWTNHVPVCEPWSCDPPVDKEITVKGLPDNDNPIHPDRFLTFSCDVPGKYLNGSTLLICGQDGQWSHPFPTCEDITCEVAVMHPQLIVYELPPGNKTLRSGQQLRFGCDPDYNLEGSAEIQCLQTGQWSAPFPTCSDKHSATKGHGRVPSSGGHKTDGRSRGEHMTRTPPSPRGCARPPLLPDGDTKGTPRSSYNPGARVEYACQRYYLMQGRPVKTCTNGEWVGEMRCLKPCTVDRDAMTTHNIAFRYSYSDKIYSTHNDEIEFRCTRGRRVGSVAMRQTCVDGEMALPSCQ